jgi:hypothetical protein
MPAAPAAAFITWNVDSAVPPDRLGPPVLGLEGDRHVLALGRRVSNHGAPTTRGDELAVAFEEEAPR